LLDRDRDEVRLDYRDEEMGRWLSALRATIRYRHLRYRGDLYHLREDIIEQRRERLASLDAQLGVVTELSVHRLSYGVDVGHDWLASSNLVQQISSEARELVLSALHPDGSRAMQLEAFVLDEITIGRRIAVEVGARAGVADLSVAARQQPAVPAGERVFGTYASALHARYLLGDGLNVVAGVVQGFLAPNLDDLAAAGCHERGYRQPSPRLAQEKSVTGELGVKLDLYGVLSATLFYGYTQLFDAILEVPLQSIWVTCGGASAVPVTVLENGSGAVHSVDASLQLEFTRWKLHSWLSWARGDSKVEGRGATALDRVPPLNGYAAGRYQFAWARSFLELALRWAAPQDQLGPADRLDPRLCLSPGGSCAGSQSYFYVSVRGGMELLRWLRLQLALENLTHERYRLHAAGVPAPGFSALLGVEASAP
jgi:outer membrane receptor protein involved in Fe transport